MRGYNKTKEIFYLITSSTVLALSVTLTVLLCIFGARLSGLSTYVTSHECTIAQPEDEATERVDATPERMYVLGVKDGKLTVYAADGYNVIEILDTYVYSLPLSDREAVANGINVYSVNELISLLEDYTS